MEEVLVAILLPLGEDQDRVLESSKEHQTHPKSVKWNKTLMWWFKSLAYAELYLASAAIFHRFEFELFDTDISDVEIAHDFFLPSPKLDSKGVRVKVI